MENRKNKKLTNWFKPIEKKIKKIEIDPLFIEKINKLCKKSLSMIKKKKHIPIDIEEVLEPFCQEKLHMIHNSIDDYNFEEKITYECHDPYMFFVEHSFSCQECDDMVEKFENEKNKYNGSTGGGYTPSVKKTIEINITHLKNWSKWNDLCFERLNIAIRQYATHCFEKCNNRFLFNLLNHENKENVLRDYGYQLQKYLKEQQYYKWHQDGGLKGGGLHEHRIITFLWYLNDVEEGGETYFFHTKIKPKKGTLLLFPACWNYNHKGETPISNDKYIITGWVYANA